MKKIILLLLIIVFNFEFTEAYSKQRFKTIDPRTIGSEEEQKEIASWEFQICLGYVEYETYYKYEPYLAKDNECKDTKYDLLVNSEEDYLYYWENNFTYNDTDETSKCIYGNCENGYGVLLYGDDYEAFLYMVGNFKNSGFFGNEIYIFPRGIYYEFDKTLENPINIEEGDLLNFKGKRIIYSNKKEKTYHFGNFKKEELLFEAIGDFKNAVLTKGIQKDFIKNTVVQGIYDVNEFLTKGKYVYTDNQQELIMEGNFEYNDFVSGYYLAIDKSNKIKIRQEGSFKKYELHGKGTLIYTFFTSKGEEITQELKATFVNGETKSGILTVSGYERQGSNYIYDGKLDVKLYSPVITGKGKVKYGSGSIYEGEFLDNQRNGKGVYKYNNGNVYTGEFKKNKKDGIGKMVYADGKIYEGKWKNGKPLINVETDKRYFALVIGNNDYQHLEKLDAAVNDAKVISEILKTKYNFEVELLLDADYETTVNKFYTLSRKLNNNDNFFIFYAGHGHLDEKQNRGYWLPVDAKPDLPSKWISNALIADELKATEAKHVLLIVDSCFSGSLMRSGDNLNQTATLDKKYIKLLESKKTRLVISSGGNEPVVDSDGGDHSVFARKLIDSLQNNEGVLSTQEIFENIRKYVASNADQTPERAAIYKAGHDGGDFLFFPKN